MQGLIRLGLGFSITILIGWLILRTILYKERRPLLEEFALSYSLGMAFIPLGFLIFWFIDIKASVAGLLVPWLLISISVNILNANLRKSNANNRESQRKFALRNISLFESFLFLGISFEVVFSFFRALIKPIESFDSIAIYGIRAKIFYLAGGIPKDFFTSVTNAFPNSGHPLMVPLAETWVYTFLNSFNDFLVKTIFPLYFVALLVIFYSAIREFFARRHSLLFTFLLATIPQFNRYASIGYADFVFAFYLTAGLLYLLRWMKGLNIRHLILSALFMACCCWTKMEGWVAFLSSIMVLFIFMMSGLKDKKRGYIDLIIFSLTTLLIASPWLILINSMQLENNVFVFKSFGPGRLISSFANFDRLPRIIYEFQKQFFGPKKWNILWIISLALFLLNIKTVFKGELRYITLSLLFIIFIYAYSYLLIPLKTGESINWNIGSSLSRLFIHFTPLSLFWVARLCKERGYL